MQPAKNAAIIPKGFVLADPTQSAVTLEIKTS